MASQSVEFGSEFWADEVFDSGPVRIVKGRTRWTHRHSVWVDAHRSVTYVESRNELIALLLLEHMWHRKLIKRFKEQPFVTPTEVLDREYTPDFFVEDMHQCRYAIEVKTERFITRALEADFEQTKVRLKEYGIQFLLWTDKRPLLRTLRHNLLRFRRASVLSIQPEEVAGLLSLLADSGGTLPVGALCEQGIDLDVILQACWFGKTFLRLTEALHEGSLISLTPHDDFELEALGVRPDIEGFWNSLEDAA